MFKHIKHLTTFNLGLVSPNHAVVGEPLIYISSKITGLKQSTLNALHEKQVLRKANKKLMTIYIFYIRNTSFCPRPEGSEPSYLKQRGTVIHLFQCLYDFSKTSTSDVSVNMSIIM